VIFVTVGSSEQPFERLVSLAAALPDPGCVVIQHGPVPAPEGVGATMPFLAFEELLEHFDRADVVVTHGGTGSVLLAAQTGHTPVVVPRLKRLGEAVDDHQAELMRMLAEEGRVIPVWEDGSLADAIAAAPPRHAAQAAAGLRLQHAVRAATAADPVPA
jgi:UDP-N-acetylglucosamine transferase subunit ALG13